MPPVYDEDYLEEERKKYYDRTISYDDWVKNGYSAGPSDGKGSITLITDVPTYEAPNDDPKFKDSYWDQVNWATYTPKKTTNNSGGGGSSGGGSSGTNDRYAGYRATLDDLYNKVMGYGSYTAGSYTPGRYSAKYNTAPLEGQLAGWLNEIDNYGDFEYDLNADLLYKQMADNYVQQGQLAMQDAMANAAAMTGGYGNSYAASVGNQAYQQHLTALNNNIPALQQQALNVWQAGLDQLYGQLDAGSQQLNNLLALEAQNFAQWQANENLAFSAWQANEDNRYNEWLAGYNQTLDQYNLGSTHIGNLETYQPKSSGGSSSSKKEDTVYYRNAYDDYMKNTAATLAATQGSPYTYEQYYEALKQQNAANYRQSVEEDQKKKNKQ